MQRALLGALVIMATVVALSACSPQEPELPPLSDLTTSPAASATKPTSTLSTDEQLAFEDAEAALRRHVALLNKLGHDPTNEKLLDQLKDTSNGKEFGIQNTTYRYDWGPKGIHLRGEGGVTLGPVTRSKALLNKARPLVELEVCADATTAIAVTKSGERLRAPGKPAKALWTVTVMHDPDGAWRVNGKSGSLVSSC